MYFQNHPRPVYDWLFVINNHQSINNSYADAVINVDFDITELTDSIVYIISLNQM